MSGLYKLELGPVPEQNQSINPEAAHHQLYFKSSGRGYICAKADWLKPAHLFLAAYQIHLFVKRQLMTEIYWFFFNNNNFDVKSVMWHILILI